MKKFVLFIFLISSQQMIFPQWQNLWTSSSISYDLLSGWLDFEENGDSWKMRFYSLDSLQFNIMSEGFSQTPEYTYSFDDAERLAGLQLYSLEKDLNNDNRTEFYVLAYHGSSPYRQSFKIIDIVTGNIVFEKNDAAYYYSYPMFADVNNDGLLDCIVVRYDYPSFSSYVYEIYSTGVSGVNGENQPVSFDLKQNHPNPFNPSTTIEFYLEESQNVTLTVYDILGSKVKTLVNGYKESGSHEIIWDGTNDSGIRQSTGVYLYRFKSGNMSSVKKMMFLK